MQRQCVPIWSSGCNVQYTQLKSERTNDQIYTRVWVLWARVSRATPVACAMHLKVEPQTRQGQRVQLWSCSLLRPVLLSARRNSRRWLPCSLGLRSCGRKFWSYHLRRVNHCRSAPPCCTTDVIHALTRQCEQQPRAPTGQQSPPFLQHGKACSRMVRLDSARVTRS